MVPSHWTGLKTENFKRVYISRTNNKITLIHHFTVHELTEQVNMGTEGQITVPCASSSVMYKPIDL